MRRRLLTSTLVVAVVTVVLLGVPLGLLGARLVRTDAANRLVESAERVATAVTGIGPSVTARQLLARVDASQHVEVVLPGGRQLGAGPASGNHPLVATARVPGGGSVSVSTPSGPVRTRALQIWLVVLGLVLLASAVAVGLAVLSARRLGLPLESLAGSAQRLGSGDTRPSGLRYGVPEIDRVAEGLDVAAVRIGELLRRERDFAGDASHQLRTPLTALSIRLEEIALLSDSDEVRAEAAAALTQVGRLTGVVDTLLGGVRRSPLPPRSSFEVATLLSEQVQEWLPAFRRAERVLRSEAPAGLSAQASRASVGQVVATLLENALGHGAGRVLVQARESGDYVVVEVCDEGAGVPPELAPRIFQRSVSGGSGTGLGLAVARSLAESEGGRLELTRLAPPVFALFLAASARPVPAAG